MLLERKKSNRLKPQDVTYNRQGIPSSLVKFLGITFDSALTFRSHFCTAATHAHHHLFKLNFIFSSTYCPSSSTLIRLYKSYIYSLFDYGAPATWVASPPNVQLSWERIQTHFILQALSIPSLIPNNRKRQQAFIPPIHDRNIHLAKRWYIRMMQHSCRVQDYIDNHTHNKHNIRCTHTTPLEQIRN